MKEIVKTLLMEGVDEEIIHRVLDVIKEDSKVDTYLKNKLENTKQELATQKAIKRNLNKTVDREANKEYRKAAGAKREANDSLNATYGGDPYSGAKSVKDAERAYDEASTAKNKAAKKFSKKGTETYHKILNLTQDRKSLEKAAREHKYNGDKATERPVVHKAKSSDEVDEIDYTSKR